MDAKEYLMQMRDQDRKIDQMIERQVELRMSICALRSPAMKEDCIQMSHSQDRIGDVTAELIDLESDIIQEMSNVTKMKKDIMQDLIAMPSESQRIVLFNHYVLGKSIYDIANERKVSARNVKKAHRRGLRTYTTMFLLENTENT